MDNTRFGIFHISMDNDITFQLEAGKKDLLKTLRKANRLIIAGRNLWLYLYANFAISPLLMLLVILYTGPGERGRNYGTMLIFCLWAWPALKFIINTMRPYFSILLLLKENTLTYSNQRLSYHYFNWSEKPKSIPFEEIESIKVDCSQNYNPRAWNFIGLRLFITLLKKDGSSIHLALHNTYAQFKYKTNLEKLPVEIYSDYRQAAQILANRIGCRFEE